MLAFYPCPCTAWLNTECGHVATSRWCEDVRQALGLCPSEFSNTRQLAKRFALCAMSDDASSSASTADDLKARKEVRKKEKQKKEARTVAIVGVVSVLAVMVSIVAVAGQMGLDLTIGAGSEANRGAGVPLSVQEVNKMVRQAKSGEGGQVDRYPGAGVEEDKEDEALMRVIMGGELRVK